MLERGDADLSSGLPPKDFDQLIKENKVKVVGVPIPTACGMWRSTPQSRRSTM